MAPRPTDTSVCRGAARTTAVRLSIAAAVAMLASTPRRAAAHPYAVAPPAPPTQPTTTGATGTIEQNPATGQSPVTLTVGKPGAAEPAPADMGDAAEFDLALGSLVSTGNARQIAVTGSTRLLLRRSRHQYSAAVAFNYGQAASSLDTEVEPTVSNLQGRVRYDLFLARRWALFAMATGRRDPFQGLDLRFNADPGAAFYVLPGADERLWVEAGYDFQFDLRSPAATLTRGEDGSLLYDFMGTTIQAAPRTRNNHAARVFGGYFNKINEAVSFRTGLEFLQSVQVARRWRLNWETALSTLLAKKLALAITFTVRIDNDPLPRVRKVDTVTAANLVYRFLLGR